MSDSAMSHATEKDQTVSAPQPFWAILELMGHVRLAGRISEETRFGVALGRIDIPKDLAGDEFTTQFFSGSSIYRLTPTTEAIARSIAKANQPAPVRRWELPQLEAAAGEVGVDIEEDEAEPEIGDVF
jgi:hypothetical protein